MSKNSPQTFFQNKKGQVTIFIIVGIVVLFIFAGVLYFSKSVIKTEFSADGTPIIQSVPKQFEPIKIYTENCLSSVGKNGLIILGQQGGYIYPELLGTFSTSKPTDSVGINLAPAKIPYWHYNSQLNTQNGIALSSLQPELYYKDDASMSIESQLNKYVKEKLDTCLENYSAFETKGFDLEQGNKKVTTNVLNGAVAFTLKMPLDMKKDKSSADMNTFYVRVPLDLKKYYTLADQIKQAEVNYTFLEKQALDLIHVFSGVDMKKLPPTSAVTFEMVPKTYWNEYDVKTRLQSMLSSYVPMLQFSGSKTVNPYKFPKSELSNVYQKTYDNMILPLTGGKDLEISFDYLNWEPYFDINSKDNKIEPQHIAVHYWMLHFGTQNYYTVYDLSYPVLVTVKDPLAFNGEGFSFVFSLESNIRNNKPAEDNETLPMTTLAFSKSMVCNSNKKNTGLLNTLVVDSFTGEPVDAVQIGFSVPGQDTCTMGATDGGGKFESKYPAVYGGILNFIKKDYLTNFYPIDTYKFKGNKSGIIGYAATMFDGTTTEVIELHKFKKINVSVKKKNLGKCLTPLVCEYTIGGIGLSIPHKDISCEKGEETCFFNSGNNLFSGKPVISLEANGSISKYNDYHFLNTPLKLKDTEKVAITLKRIKDINPSLSSEEFISVVTLKGEELQEVDLVPGIYEVTANLILDEETIIPEEERCFSYDIVSWAQEECFTINETRADQFIEGLVSWDTEKTYLKITAEDLYSSDNLEFYVLSQDIKNVPLTLKGETKECAGVLCLPGGIGCAFNTCDTKEIDISGRVVEDLQLAGKMADLSKKEDIRKGLEPVFS